MKHRLKRLEQHVRNLTCAGCGRPRTELGARGERVSLDPLNGAEPKELLGLLRLTAGTVCPGCGCHGCDATARTEDQLDALLALLQKLMGPDAHPLLTA